MWVNVVGKNKIILAKFMKKISIVWKRNILTTISSRLIVYNNKQTKRKIANKRVGQKEKKLYSLSFANVSSLTDLSKIVRGRSLITSPGGGAVVLEGGTILKQAPFWGVNFSLVRNMRGVKFMTQQQQSREFDVSDISSMPPTSLSSFKKQKRQQFHSWTQTTKL